MKPRLLGLTLLAALALAGLWLLRTDGGRTTAASATERQAAADRRPVDLEIPSDDEQGSRSAAPQGKPPTAEVPEASATGTGGAAPSVDAGSIHGLLFDAMGRPISANTSLLAYDALDSEHERRALVTPHLGERVLAFDELGGQHEGVIAGTSYRIGELAPGRYWVQARVEGYRPGHGEVDIASAEEVELDLVLVPAVLLTVRVLTPEEAPHPDVVAGATGYLVPVPTHEPVSGWFLGVRGSIQGPHGIGRFHDTQDRREEGILGNLELDGDLPVHVNLCKGQWVIASELVPAGSDAVTFHVDPDGLRAKAATLRVRAIDASTGEVVTHVSVMLHSSSFGMQRVPSESGITEFADLSPGTYGISVFCEGFGWEQRDVLAEPGKLTEVDVELGASATIDGRIVDDDGRALGDPNEEVFAKDVPTLIVGHLDPDTQEGEWDESMRHGVDAEGRFSLQVGRGIHLLRVATEDWTSSTVRVDARHGSVGGIEVVAHRPVAVVLRVESEALKDARFHVLDEQGIELQGGRFALPGPHKLALAPGTYRLVVSDSSGTTLFESAFVATEGTVVVPVRL